MAHSGFSFLSRLLAAILLACCLPAAALNPQLTLDDFHHAMWTAKDGAPADIDCMAQTPDGWLWLGTSTGLYRFDGVQFERYALDRNGVKLRSRISELVARPNGDLWIGDAVGGLAVRHKDGTLVQFMQPENLKPGAVRNLAFDRDGSMWVIAVGGLFRHDGRQWQQQGPQQGWTEAMGGSLLLDRQQRLWAGNEYGLSLYNRATKRFEPTGLPYLGSTLVQSPDGRVWIVDKDKVQLVPSSVGSQPRAADFNSSESRRAQFDRDGNLWALNCPKGVCLLPRAGEAGAPLLPARDARDRYDQRWQLSSLSANVVLEDREGNVWIATNTGLDRFRENKLVPAHLPEQHGYFSMASDTEGGVWVSDAPSARTWQLVPGQPPKEYSGKPVMLVANDRDGALLLAGSREIERRYKGKSETFALPPGRDGKPADLYVSGLLDDGKVLWMATPQTGLVGRVNGQWLPRQHFQLPPRIFLAAVAGPGQLWMSIAGGTMVLYDNGKQTSYPDGGIGLASMIHVGPEVLVSGEKGLVVFQGGAFRPVPATDPEALTNISGMAVTADGDRWLNGSKGVLHVRKDDWLRAMRQPGTPLQFDLIGVLEGYQGQAMLINRLPSVFTAPDGQLWFMTIGDVLRLDPSRRSENPVPPGVDILRVNAGDASYAAGAAVRLPPATSGFSIQFTAPSLRKPEAVRFAYQLEGEDSGWQDAGTRRTAFYTNVGPGSYRFRVKAMNDGGVGSVGEATMAVTIAPTFSQTWWFKGLCALAALGALTLLYRYRLHVATARLGERMQVRMDERERIARTLHDSFLQSVHAIILRLDTVTRNLPHDSPARLQLESVLDNANDAVTEGRDRVYELRSGPVDDLAASVRAAGQSLADTYPGIAFAMAVGGASQPVECMVAEEMVEIAREALRNAFRHARAGKVEVRLGFGTDVLSLHIIDDGQGMTVSLPGEDGKPGRHWGLTGMRERAARIGARLDIDSKEGIGTSVALTLPARLAYEPQAGKSLRNWFAA